MNAYIDVGVVRVQRYLARPRHLRTQRGGSELIKFATSKLPRVPDEFAEPNAKIVPVNGQEWDPVAEYCRGLEDEGCPGWTRNDAAGDIAGVVSVVNHGEEDLSKEQLRKCARLLMGRLREELPNAELEAYGVSTAKTYVEAYDEMHAQAPLGTALPLWTDFPGLLPCDECGASPVTAGKTLTDPDTKVETSLRVCDDCDKRLGGRGRGKELASQKEWLTTRTFLVEGKLLNEVIQDRRNRLGAEATVGVAEDFAHLADLQLGSDRTNHLATVWIDGDSIGERFKSLENPKLRQEAVAKLSQATEQALIRASLAVCEDRYDKCPVIPHVLGGDDVLVTLVASKAWQFARAFLKVFEEATKEWLPGTTVSAAMVFARQNYPFAAQLDRAEELLGKTKRYGARYRSDPDHQQSSCVGWVDLTREESLAMSEFCLSLQEIEEISGNLDRLNKEVSTTQRQTWIRLLGDEDAVHARNRLYSDAQRAGNLAEVRQVFPNNKLLRQRLEMLRWWS